MLTLPRVALRTLPAVLGLTIAAGCGGSADSAADPAAQQVAPFGLARSIASPEHAGVVRALRNLAAVELTLADDFAPLSSAADFTAYLHEVSGAETSTRAAVVAAAQRRGNCARVESAVQSASAALSTRLRPAVGRLEGRVSVVRAHAGKVEADRRAVAAAAAVLQRELAADPAAYAVPGVHEVSSTVTSIANWMTSVAAAIKSADGKARSYAAVADSLSQQAAGVGATCRTAAAQERANNPAARAGAGTGADGSTAGTSTSGNSGGTPTPPASHSGYPSPSASPTASPAESPTPSGSPTDSPSPSDSPTDSPSPSDSPTDSPTDSPSPSDSPTDSPTDSPSPSDSPTDSPTDSPAESPTPSDSPSE